MFTCPVCFYDKLQEPARDYNICDCCGTEFGNDDEVYTYEQLRHRWIANGAHWFFGDAPIFWNPWQQMVRANVQLPYEARIRPGSHMNREFFAHTSLTNLGIAA